MKNKYRVRFRCEDKDGPYDSSIVTYAEDSDRAYENAAATCALMAAKWLGTAYFIIAIEVGGLKGWEKAPCDYLGGE